MKQKTDYRLKFQTLKEIPLFRRLQKPEQAALKSIAFLYRLTFQEFKQLVEASRDLEQWQEQPLSVWWQTQNKQQLITKNQFLHKFRQNFQTLKSSEKIYPTDFISKTPASPLHKTDIIESKKTIGGLCPVASDKTVCCNLHTLDVVENCPYACSYCTIQTFYSNRYIFDKHIKEKLMSLKLNNKRFYHFGSGQSSDSLVWGNKYGILDALYQFAENNPNILLELKTKSNNIDYFLNNNHPKNVVLSWTLNTPTIIQHEEHQTATMEERLKAAVKVVSYGIKTAFHFHPMVYYHGWQQEYESVVAYIMHSFTPEDILFISFGSVTLIKPVLEKIRLRGVPTKITQMEMVKDPHGKYTYPDEIKITLFRHIYRLFDPWKKSVFFYLCMEKQQIWHKVFGYAYDSNELFEAEYGRRTMIKII
jgi:spore photoproduct lyase